MPAWPALRAGLDVDGEYSLQALHPRHRRRELVGIHPAPCSSWHDLGTVLEVRGEHPVESRITVSSAPNEGIRFEFDIPALAA